MADTCKTCRWFDANPSFDIGEYARPAGGQPLVYQTIHRGPCRISAPRSGGFPIVRHDDWCGEHSVKPADRSE